MTEAQLGRKVLYFLVLIYSTFVTAQGHWPCTTTSDCPAYYTSSGHQISPNSECVADPLDPSHGFCGYVGATCTTADDCDYGQCTSGTCSGFVGDSCTDTINNLDCLGSFGCSSIDNTCGGQGTDCTNGDLLCASESCTSDACDAIAEGGMTNGSGCNHDSMCSNHCANTGPNPTFLCANVDSPSSRARSRQLKARQMLHDNAGKLNFKRHTGLRRRQGLSNHLCNKGQTACPTSAGGSSASIDYECIDTTSSLEACGGCPTLPKDPTYFDDIPLGVDCTILENVEDVLCSRGKCLILSCTEGAILSANKRECTS